MKITIKSLGLSETITVDPEIRCDCCGGIIPSERDWTLFDESNNGYCAGHIRVDGICGGFSEAE